MDKRSLIIRRMSTLKEKKDNKILTVADDQQKGSMSDILSVGIVGGITCVKTCMLEKRWS